jgi:hypothetical protein
MFRRLITKFAALAAVAALAIGLTAGSADAQSKPRIIVVPEDVHPRLLEPNTPSVSRPTNNNSNNVNRPIVAQPTTVNLSGVPLGAYHRDRAQARLRQLPAADASRFARLFTAAASARLEQGYLAKALAAGYGMNEIEAFARDIRGQSPSWMRDNLHLVHNSAGRGVMQQWQMSCGPATVQALLAEFDPIYALRTNQRNPQLTQADNNDGMRLNPTLASEQRTWLESQAPDGNRGMATPRGDRSRAGRGRWCEDLMSRRTGVTYRAQLIGGAFTVDSALAQIDAALRQGVPVPIVAKSGDGSHYALVYAVSNSNGQRTYTIHEPYYGQVQVRTEADFRAGRLNLAGNQQLMAVSLPSR